MKDKPHRRRRGDREIRRAARQGDRGAGADRRFIRQRAGRAGHRRQDRGATDRRIRRSRNAAQARKRNQAGQAAAVADRQRRARAHLQAAGHARQQCRARRAGRRTRGARAGLQAPDRVPQGDGVLHHHPPHRREDRHRCERGRGGCEAGVGCARSALRKIARRAPGGASADLFAPPSQAKLAPAKEKAARRPHPHLARRRARRESAQRQDRPLQIRMRAHAGPPAGMDRARARSGRAGGRHRDHQPRRHAGAAVRLLARRGAERGLLRADRPSRRRRRRQRRPVLAGGQAVRRPDPGTRRARRCSSRCWKTRRCSRSART